MKNSKMSFLLRGTPSALLVIGAGFVGLTGETFNGDAAIIATATMTSNAMKESTNDAFAAFNSIKGGEQ